MDTLSFIYVKYFYIIFFLNHSSLPGSLRNRNSAPPTKHVDLTATDVQGNPLPPPPPDTPDQEYMSLVAEGIYDTGMSLK